MKTGTPLATSVVIMLACLCILGQAARAQAPNLPVNATETATCTGPVTCAGTVAQGGILNGTSVIAFAPGATPTLDPDTASFSYDWTLTTVQGQLRVRFVNLFNGAAGVTAAIGTIDPNTSTGTFARATGVLFNSGRVISYSPFTVKTEITGEINLVK